MLQSIRDFPVLYMIILISVLLCIFFWIMALRASRKRNARRDALIARLEREKELRRTFKEFTQQQLIDTPPEPLLEGICCHIQMELEAQEDGEAAFADLPEHKRLVYALGYVMQDSREALSGFFKVNGPPLTGAALQAVLRLLDAEAAGAFQREFEAYDEENEEVSLIKEDIEFLDAQWKCRKEALGEAFLQETKEYIMANFVGLAENIR